MMEKVFQSGVFHKARFVASPNFDQRPAGIHPEVIIIHSISLPPGEYQGDFVEQFFCNQLNSKDHPYFEEISDLKVSSHFFIRRNGELIQFVKTDNRAWHAGVSNCLGRDCVNDFSIGIELEGWDEANDGFTNIQYQILTDLCAELIEYYDMNKSNIFSHSDIAPERKNDPGPYFDWQRLDALLNNKK